MYLEDAYYDSRDADLHERSFVKLLAVRDRHLASPKTPLYMTQEELDMSVTCMERLTGMERELTDNEVRTKGTSALVYMLTTASESRMTTHIETE